MRLIRFSSSLILIFSGVNAVGWSATPFRSFFNCRAYLSTADLLTPTASEASLTE